MDVIDTQPPDRQMSSADYDLIEKWWNWINEVVNAPTFEHRERLVREPAAGIMRIHSIAQA